MDGLSGGFVYGIGGSGLITPRLGYSPAASGTHTPAGEQRAMSPGAVKHELQQVNAAFEGAS